MKNRFIINRNIFFNILFNPHVTSILLIIIVCLIAFKDISNIFFQQDEWLGLGGAIVRNETGGLDNFVLDIFQKSVVSRFLPLTSISNYIVFNLFKTNTSYYGLLALIFAMVNSSLVYLVVKKLTKLNSVALITSLLWLTNNLSLQSITWISAVIPSQSSVLLFLISFYLLMVYLEKNDGRLLFTSVLLMLCSLWFKETGIYYVIIFPLYTWLLVNNVKRTRKIISIAVLIIPIFVSVAIPRLSISKKSGAITSATMNLTTKENIVYNTLLIPARSLYQVYFPYQETYKQITKAKSIHYSEVKGNVIESLVADAYSLLVAFWILFIVFLTTLLAKKRLNKLIFFALISFFASTLPFIVFENNIAFIEQRLFVFPAIWASLLIAVCFYSLFSRKPKIRSFMMIVVFLPLISINIQNLHEKLNMDIFVGSYRKGILETVAEIEPKLTNQNMFYFFTDHTGFWEFQSGFGQTLAVWLYDSGKIPREVLTDMDFWDSSYEGIKDYQGAKYGYFMTYDRLLGALDDYPAFDLTNLHSYYWDYQKHTVTNVSDDIRTKLKVDLNPRSRK